MPSNFRYSAAKTSNLNKIFKSPTKKKNTLKGILPSQVKYKQNLNKSDEGEQLQISDYDVKLDYQLSRNNDIITAIDTIVDNQWTESSSLDRFIDETETMEQRVFKLSGLSMAVKAEIMKYRLQLPQGLITTNQLYSIFENEGNTFVDKSVELAIRQGKVRKFIITNASPIISNINKKTTGKMTYGYENVEILTKSETYFHCIDKLLSKYKDKPQEEILQKFLQFVKTNPNALYVSMNNGFAHNELSMLIDLGFLTLTSNHLNEIESQQYSISYPNCGIYLKLINTGRSWIVKTLSKSKFKEYLEDQLISKWEGSDLNGSKMNNYRKPFYGFELNWILADCLGSGILEVFNTPVGRGWKLTGKR
ncbi:putative serine/threonine-protein kinase Mug51p [[Candida] jaroonii]|uniref:Serine/threonine-protein kinase Mug51p n=1 Tax=[Candida] jaroonii TaxID=467808 RepID=A0ACA9Y8I4_9ASCO|nr:putative serine/threonine-protein kinase Mug51p [[Candida] jaroonii]